MHIDVVLEVLGHLHPLDLVHLSRTTREFRTLLCGPALDRLWRESFVEPLPMCPSDIPGRRWAHLLFGRNECEKCRWPKAPPNFNLVRRLCTKCTRNLLTSIWRYDGRYPFDLRTLVVLTRNDGERSKASIRDVDAVVQEYKRLDQESSDGPSALAAFVENRSKMVRERQEAVERCERWERGLIKQKQARDAENLKNVQAMSVISSPLTKPSLDLLYFISSITEKLLKEGHDLRDINKMHGKLVSFFSEISRFSLKRWNKVRARAISRVLDERRWRLEIEYNQRCGIASSAIYETIRTNRRPCTWAYTPSVFQSILEFPQFTQLTERPIDDSKDQDEFVVVLAPDDARLVAALAAVPKLLDSYVIEERAVLRAKVPDALGSDSRPPTDVLELATTAFTPGEPYRSNLLRCLVFVGWKDAGACRSYQRQVSNVVFCGPASTAAGALVRLVGLDPFNTTAEQMDTLDPRFVCNDCAPKRYRREVMGWRLCLQHAFKHARTGRHISAWTLLSATAARDVRRREGNDPARRASIWLCNLCPAHWAGLREDKAGRVRHKDVIAHLSTEYVLSRSPIILVSQFLASTTRCLTTHIISARHDIGRTQATEGVHFFSDLGIDRPSRRRVFMSCGIQSAEYRCNHCVAEAPQAVKLLSLRAVMAHIQGRHNVDAPSESDYVKVERLISGKPTAA
ncbi:hypothetical protein C8R45DRAFT_1217917 [Mycena sanguinolenta]|nr:hypothetical protein C8R45DRAFT_1217917 [Mycena sanguinolenta]